MEFPTVEIDRFLDGYRSAREDWKHGQLYAQYDPRRDPEWRDGYAMFVRTWNFSTYQRN